MVPKEKRIAAKLLGRQSHAHRTDNIESLETEPKAVKLKPKKQFVKQIVRQNVPNSKGLKPTPSLLEEGRTDEALERAKNSIQFYTHVSSVTQLAHRELTSKQRGIETPYDNQINKYATVKE